MSGPVSSCGFPAGPIGWPVTANGSLFSVIRFNAELIQIKGNSYRLKNAAKSPENP